MKLNNITFKNAKGTWGGAVSVKDNGCTISNCNFVNNTAEFGGAIRCEAWDITVSGCTFTDNTADYGGTVELHEGVDGAISNCNFKNNIANHDGGALNLLHSTGAVSGCSFENNRAGENGGAIYYSGENAKISGCIFIGNTAPDGVIYYDNSFYNGLNANNNIFLNHPKGSEISFNKTENANIDYNWFANNASDYKTSLTFKNVSPNVWLFLNGTEDYAKSEIAFKLYAYNKTSKKATEYDSSALKPVDLTITPTNMKVDKGTAKLTEPIKYEGTGSVTAKIENAQCTVEVKNQKNSTKVIINNITDGVYNTTAAIVNYEVENKTRVTFTITKKDGTPIIADMDIGKLEAELSKLNSGAYILSILNEESENYTASRADASFNVLKANITVELKSEGNLIVGNPFNVTFTLPGDIDGKVRVTVDGKDATADKVNEIYVVEFDSLPAEKHTVAMNLTGDSNYKDTQASLEITIAKGASSIEITNITTPILINTSADVGFKISPNVTDNAVTLWINGKEILTYDFEFAEETFLITPDKFPTNGTYNITVQYKGNNNYNASNNATSQITVNKCDANISVEINPVSYGENATAEVRLPSDAKGNITVKVDGKEIATYPITGSELNITLPELKVGNHTAEITYCSDGKYNQITETAEVIVDKQTAILTAPNVTATYNYAKTLEINLADGNNAPIANAEVIVNINGAETYTTDADGKISIDISGLTPNEYTADISFVGNENYTGASASANVTVNKASPKMTAKAKTFKNTDKNKKYTITLKDNKGNAIKNAQVSLKVNGKTYFAKTNSKGKATFTLKKLTKTGKATITYKGDKYYTKLIKKATLTVKSVWKTISKGSKDNAMVKKIQRALKNNGHYLRYGTHYLMVDGIFEKYTEMAVKGFQRDHNLKATGKVDYNTAKKLKII